jgi:predicted Zn-dependent peptidase
MADLYAPVVARLASGLQVLSVERPSTKTFAASFLVRAGRDDDPPGIPGLAHAVEHVSFLGANLSLSRELASNGAGVNAFTGSEVTSWHITGHVDQLDVALQLVANVLRPEPLSSTQLDAEKRIIGHEYANHAEGRREAALNSYYAKAFGMANRYNARYFRKCLSKITPHEISAFQRNFLQPTNARLAIVSPANSSTLCSALEQYLGPDTPSEASEAGRPNRRERERVIKIYSDRYRYVWLTSSHILASTTPQMRLVAEIVTDLLGGGPHSHLFRGLRDERSLAYDVGTWKSQHLTIASVSCHTTVHCRSALEALRLMLEHQNAISREGLTNEQYEQARARIRRYHEMGVDHPQGLSWYLAFEALRNPEDQLLNASQLIGTIMKLSLEDANHHAKELLAPKNRSVFVGGMLWMLGRWRARRLIRELSADQ